ncbi:MAG: HAD family hydrolase [Boseongicola sp.]
MIDAVVFDIGRVLLDWQPEVFYDKKIGVDRRRSLFAECDLHEMNKAIDLGSHSRDVAYAHAEKHPAWADEIRLWHDSWIEMASPDIPGSATILRALKAKGFPIFSLTNFGVNTLDWAKTHYSVLTEFDLEFISGELGLVKPDPAIYDHVERHSGVSPDRLIFTDDSPANIAAAAKRGWKTHLFDGPKGWADRLISEGLLSDEDIRD